MKSSPKAISSILASLALIGALSMKFGIPWDTTEEEAQVVDTDNDGLANDLELKLGTDPKDEDTDGDGFLDGKEYSLQNSSDPYTYNPLIADTAQILVSIMGEPQISVDYITSDGETIGESIAKGKAVSSGSNSSVTRSESLSVETSVQISAQVGTQSFVGETVGTSIRGESSFGVTRERSHELQQNMQKVREKSSSSEISRTNGRMEVMVKVENVGQLAATLQGFSLSAVLTYPNRPGVERQLGGMNYDNRWGDFPASTLKPGETKEHLPFIKSEINLETMEEITNCLANGGKVVIRVATYQLIDPNDESQRPLDRFFTDIDSKTAMVSIDYGPQVQRSASADVAGHQDTAEVYRLSTFVNDDEEALTANEAFRRLQIPLENGMAEWSRGTFGRMKLGVTKVRQRATNPDVGGYWVVIHSTPGRNGARQVRLYNPMKESVDFDKLILERRDKLQLIYISDQDHDGLGDRQELAIGTSPLIADTDRDGLDDGEEFHGWKLTVGDDRIHVTSSPLDIDSDRDGVSDADEKLAGTNPSVSEYVLVDDWRVAYSRQLGSRDRDSARNIAIDHDDNIYLAGDTDGNSVDGNSGGPYMVAKYSPNGEKLWLEQHRNAIAHQGTTNTGGMAIDSQGNMYTVDSEYTKKESHGRTIVTRRNYLTVNKFDSNGKRVWSQELDSKSSDLAHGMIVDHEDNVYVTGYTQGTLGDRGKGDWKRPSQEAFIGKYGPDGKVLWIKQWKVTFIGTIRIDAEGNLVMLARVGSGQSLDGEPYEQDGIHRNLAILKYTPAGERVWAQQFGFDKSTSLSAIATDDQGGIYVAGTTQSRISEPNKGYGDAFVMKYDSAGERLWVQQIGTAGSDSFNSLSVRHSMVYATGTTNGDFASESRNTAKDQDIFVATFSTLGKPLTIKQIKTDTTQRVAESVVDSHGAIYIFATTYDSFDIEEYENRGHTDMLLLKLIPIVTQYQQQL